MDSATKAESHDAKASARLLELAGPLLADPGMDDAKIRIRLQFTMIAWNLAVLEASATDTAELRAKIREMGIEVEIDEMAKKKASLFPDDLRQLLDVEVTREADGGHFVRVLSAT